MTPATAQATSARQTAAISLAALAALVFVAGTFVAPLAESAGLGWGRLLHLVYSPACHQMPERSLTVGQGVQAVCARCSGLYLGGVIGLFAGAWLVPGGRPRLRPVWLAWAVAPTVIDALLPWVGLQGLSDIPRLLLALPAGLVAALFLAVGIGDLAARMNEHPRDTRGSEAPRALEEIDG